jgi:S-DNA-T family DNA segregation ATPase FtsK/SpoIIIE
MQQQQKAELIDRLFNAHKIKAHVASYSEGLRTCQYNIKLDIGEKVSKVKSVSEELALLVQSVNKPKIDLDTASGHITIETTVTSKPITVPFETLAQDVDFTQYELPLVVGADMQGKPMVVDLAEAPHILIGGSTGAGKSVLCNTIIHSLMRKYTSEDIQFGFIDPKSTELTQFKNSAYCGMYASDYESATELIDKALTVMEDRYKLLSLKGYTSLKEFRKKERHPYIVIVIDELADILLQDKKEFLFTKLVRLLQKARAAGIHVIANTQRPSRDVLKGLLKANMPVQIALKTSSNFDSRVIIGEDGAEKLVGKGDMLVRYNGNTTRVQGAL